MQLDSIEKIKLFFMILLPYITSFNLNLLYWITAATIISLGSYGIINMTIMEANSPTLKILIHTLITGNMTGLLTWLYTKESTLG